MAFDDAAVRALFASVVSHAESLGLFEQVLTHEPKSAPQDGLSCAIWVDSIKPAPQMSGLAATSGVVVFSARIYRAFKAQPEDKIDQDVLAAAATLLKEYSGAFTLGGTVRDVDLLGATGTALSAQAGYIQHDNTIYRVMIVTLPVVISDLWGQAA